MRKIIFLFIVIGSIAVINVSCQECEPQTAGSNQIHIAFFDIDSIREEGFDDPVTVSYDSIYVDGVSTNLFSEASEATLTLLLSPAQETTSYIFASQDGNDTLNVTYNILNKVNSPDCGLSVEYSNVKLLDSGNSYDSVVVIKENIDFSGETNIKIYTK